MENLSLTNESWCMDIENYVCPNCGNDSTVLQSFSTNKESAVRCSRCNHVAPITDFINSEIGKTDLFVKHFLPDSNLN